ncbi:MFS transporter [uncultured Phenylobacterium sp.]|uniref:MFS transporter n=1 Tax=uncultured Phenylobacterium sp. TaxID=349273 RepID=UPI0025E42794|nr:MFS transporter [uncultured Phenylobacterium sp.]
MTAATAAAMSASSSKPLSLGRTLAFSATSLPIAALAVAITVHLPAYFAASLGVPLVAVAAAFATCRTIDIPVEPALGMAMDRTRTRWGRYRVWTVLGAPLLMGGLFMLLNAGRGVGTGYLITWLMVMYLGLSILGLAHAAWGSTLARSYEQRARIFGIMGGVGVIGSLGVLAIPIIMEANGYSDAQGVRAMVWYIIALAPIAVAIVVWRTPETIAPEAPGQKFRLRDYLELVTHPSMARILLADLCLTLGPGWMAALFLFFSRDRMLFTTGQANLLLVVYIVAGLVGAPTTGWVASKIGKHRAAMLSSAIYSLALVTLLFLPRGNVWASVPTNFATGFVAAGFTALIRAMVADVADDVRLTQGKERAGLLYALITSTSKVALAAAIIITYPVLASIGYDPTLGPKNSPEAIEGLTIAFLAGPIGFLALGAACFIGYKLTAERATETRRLLDERDAQHAS